MAAKVQGIPNPRKTLTPLLPVTLPIAESAYFSLIAACLLANRSGRLVPIATKVIAVISALRPTRQPKTVARSPITVVKTPIRAISMKNASQPLSQEQGGTHANSALEWARITRSVNEWLRIGRIKSNRQCNLDLRSWLCKSNHKNRC